MTTQNQTNSFSDMKTIFVSNLDKRTIENELYKIVDNIAKNQINNVFIRKEEHYETAIAYINMNNHEAAKMIISKLNGTTIRDSQVRMSWALSNPSRLHQNDANVFVKNIKRDVTQHALQEIFERFGEILSCKLSTNEKGESNGFGYVNFVEVESSTKAIEAKEELAREIGDEGFSVSRYDKPQKSEKTNLYVGNIHSSITQEDFVKYFETFGPIRVNNGKPVVAFYTVNVTGKKKGYVNFETAQDAEKALTSPKLNVLGEGELVIDYYKTKTERKKELKMKEQEVKKIIQTDYKDFNLYVKTDKPVITLEEINAAFAECGEIYSVKIRYTRERQPDGIFYICMKNKEDKEKVVKKCAELNWQSHQFKPREMSQNKFNPYMMFPMQMNNGPMNYAHNPFMMTIFNMLQSMTQGYNQMGQYPMAQMRRQQGQVRSQGSQKKQRVQNKQKERRVEEPKPAAPVQPEKEVVVTQEMKNDLGDNLYDYIIDKHQFDDEMTGRITGVLLESLDYHDLKKKLSENKNDLDAIIQEIKMNLDNM